VTFAISAAPSRSAANVNATTSRHMPRSLIRIQRLFIIAGYHHCDGLRVKVRDQRKRSDEVAADEDRGIMAAVAPHVLSLVDGTERGRPEVITPRLPACGTRLPGALGVA
jgi:hypothetical protein